MKNDWLATFEALRDVYVDSAYSNIAINEALAKHDNCSQGFVRTFVKGVIGNTILLDFYIDKLATKGVKGIKKRTLIIIRMGIYAISSLDSVPDHAACNEAVALAKRVSKGSDRFVNAILRNYIRKASELSLSMPQEDEIASDSFNDEQINTVSIIKSYNPDIVATLNRQYGASECLSILDGLEQSSEVTIRTNLTKISREELVDRLNDDGIACQACDGTRSGITCSTGNLTTTHWYKEGYFSIQNRSSIMAIEAFGPQERSRVLDMCAAPGGKSAAMAELMNDNCEIIACDIHQHRLKLIDATARRIGLTSIKTMELDGTKHVIELEDMFDYVLCDVPCSGLGVIGSKPEIKLKRDIVDNSLPDIQFSILRNAYSYVKSGGRVMYSTCTINKDENDGVIQSFIEEHDGAAIVEKKTIMPYNNSIGFYYCIIGKN